ncbi:protein unc-50 homolog [Zophobas morio]|uniref:protein unc-50 homolog n=1 Tax=Zophobas morio TaxID=2755281 RepID=UPI003082CF1F
MMQERRLSRYWKRIFYFQHMDFEVAFSDLKNLCYQPKKVYENIYYNKQTKLQWARDDPAFLVLLIIFLLVTSCGYYVYFRFSLRLFIIFVCRLILIEFFGLGAVISTLLCFIGNKYLLQSPPHSVPQSIEWAYAFDIHCNSFFPLFLILYVLHLFFKPIINSTSFLSLLFSNTLFLIASCYYCYTTFLGYKALPFLRKTVYILSPVLPLTLFYGISVYIHWNIGLFFLRSHGFIQ